MADIRKRNGKNGPTYQVRYPSKATKSGYAYATFRTMKEARAFVETGEAHASANAPRTDIKTVRQGVEKWLEICVKEGRDGRDPVRLDPIVFNSDDNPTEFAAQRQFDTVNVSDALSRPAEIIEGPQRLGDKVSMTVRLPTGTKFGDLISDKGRVVGAAGQEWPVKITRFGPENDKAVVETLQGLEKGAYNLLLVQKNLRPIIVVGFQIS